MKLRAGNVVALLFAAFGIGAHAESLVVAAFPVVGKIVQAAIPTWKKQYPDIDIKGVGREYTDHHSAITLALATGSNLPDITALEFSFAQAVSSSGALAAIPTDIDPATLFYRHDILQKAGFSGANLIRSWDSYLTAGRKIKSATGSYLISHARDLKDIVIRTNLKDMNAALADARALFERRARR
jgi:multiple sugar transport system substrate-binding protein